MRKGSIFFAILQVMIQSSTVPATNCQTSEDSYNLPTEGPLATPEPPGSHLIGLVAGLTAWTEGIKLYETPIAVRFTHLIDMMMWNCAAIYSHNWKDALTKGNTLLHTPAIITIQTTEVSLHTSDLRLLCIAHSWATVVQDWVPEASTAVFGMLADFQYPDITPGYNSNVDACFDMDNDGEANKNCLEDLAESHCYAPSIIGAIVGRQISEYARRDGYNMYGELNRDGTHCTANCRRYTDPTGYEPKNGMIRWQPLLEDNGRGYFTRQEHVTPHIGTLAKTVLLSRKEFRKRKADSPNYNYNQEARRVAKRLASLDDEKKMLIEFFDDKLAVNVAVASAVVMRGASFEQTLNFLVGSTAAEYDATLLAWKEKVRHDLIRPTTWIQNMMSENEFITWAGPHQGKQKIKGKNFESYKRVMPHSEYVSGSGCICQVLYEFTDGWLNTNLGMSQSIPLVREFQMGSSTTEPGLTPASNITVKMSNMSELRDACGKSRLDGGMHFTSSVPASYSLCRGVGHVAVNFANRLWHQNIFN